jgi:predicted nucleic acid-binding Zn ribbon protein
MRRLSPRPLGAILERVTREAAPVGTLARIQAVWTEVVGPGVAAEAEPAGERDGVLTVRCSSAVWAQELELLSEDLLARLQEALGGEDGPRSLRVLVGSPGAPQKPSGGVL